MKTFYKASLLLFVIAIRYGKSTAQEVKEDSIKTIWKHNGSVSFSFSNVGLENWVGGGQNSISLGSILDGAVKRETKQSFWETKLNIAFGVARVGNKDNLFKKTDDQLTFSSIYGYKLQEHWNFNASIMLRTQLAPGYIFDKDLTTGKEFIKATISKAFAPAFITPNLNFQYKYKDYKATISPLANRIVLVLDDSLSKAGAFGVQPGKKLQYNLGYAIGFDWTWKPIKNITYKTNFNLFSPYDNLQTGVVNWDNLLVFKVNEYFFASFTTQLFYDHNVLIPQPGGSQKLLVQFKHVLNINVGFKF
ncbi:MAG: DUF3078 domain-containing protein [Microscillaceae bacterium]|nr:DUF3078 domain-containing protein [Microscillaceae bacterium]MDW8461689.1 DUF3078 domain-containing protein [Cytophagales bacterium]